MAAPETERGAIPGEPAPHAAMGVPVSPAAVSATHVVQPISPAPPASSTVAHTTHAAPPGAAFDRIDSGATPQVLSRTPQRLDVGVRDPGLGWVEIRAHAAEGQIAATVSTSAAVHSAVAAQLPAMRDYLAGQQVRVDTLNAQTFGASAEGGRHAPGQQSGHAAKPPASPVAGPVAEAEAESLSWIDVRV